MSDKQNNQRYAVIITNEAKRGLDKAPANLRNRLLKSITMLANDPYPSRHKALRGYDNYFRIPIEEWRIIYTVEEDIITVTIVRVVRKTGPETYFDLEN